MQTFEAAGKDHMAIPLSTGRWNKACITSSSPTAVENVNDASKQAISGVDLHHAGAP